MKKILSRILCLAFCGALCFALVGCGNAGNGAEANEAAENRAYMSQLNTSMDTLKEKLDAFGESAAAGDLVKMRTDASKVASVIDQIRGYKVPDKLKDISAKYLEGLDSLECSMNAYISLFESVEGGKDVNADSKLAEIQAEYDKGIAALQEADNLAKELK